MFSTIIKKYLLTFFITFAGYSFINWFLTLHLETKINEEYLNFWIPFVLCYAISYFVFRPIIKRLNYKKKTADLLLWGLLPVTIWIPVAFSQEYFKDISYKVISIDEPGDIDQYQNERFFKIKHFVVDTARYFLIKERHTSGKFGSTLNLNSYFVVPIFDDSTGENSNQVSHIGYGVKFHESLNNGILFKEGQEEKVAAFWQKSKEDYYRYDFYDVSYFERIKNTDDTKYFLEAVSKNGRFDKDADNIVLVKRNGTIQDLYSREKKKFLYTTLIFLTIGLVTLFFVDRYQLKAQQRT